MKLSTRAVTGTVRDIIAAMERIVIRPVGDEDRIWLREFMERRWGADLVLGHGAVSVPSQLAGFVAELKNHPAGVITYQDSESGCEIVTLDSVIERHGIATALISQVESTARQRGLARMWLITTNDNVNGLRFYQRRGFRLCRLEVGAVDRSRQMKPEIPIVAENGIPITDELELEKRL